MSPTPGLSRRAFVAAGLSAAAGAAKPALGAEQAAAGATSGARAAKFPERFLWGTATAAHQVEGNNVNADLWVLEHLKPSIFAEPSGDACDHYHRYPEDIKLTAGLGFNSFRFSIEWARIEPEPGQYSIAALDHYRRVLAACRESGLAPMVTFWHFTAPRWFAAMGGWEVAANGDHFVRYCERAVKHLGDLIGGAATFNEPNIPALLQWMFAAMPVNPFAGSEAILAAAARKVGSERFSAFMQGKPEVTRDVMLATHRRAVAAIKAGPGDFPVGVTLALGDEQAVGGATRRDEKREALYGAWLDAASQDDYIGVQTYTRSRVGPSGDLPPDPGTELTQMGYEFYPEALEGTIRYAAACAKVPVIVTENGVATADDTRRVEFIRRALAGVKKCLDDGIDVRGYYYWSLFDNFEWNFGYRPTFGIVAVDRTTFARTAKPSARVLGGIARANAL